MVRRGSPIQAQRLVHLFSTIQSVCSKCHMQQLEDAHWMFQGIPKVCQGGQLSCGLHRSYCGCSGKAKFLCHCLLMANMYGMQAGDRHWPGKPNPGAGWQSVVESDGGQVHPQTPVREVRDTWERLSLSSGGDLEMASFQQHRAVGKQKGESNC